MKVELLASILEKDAVELSSTLKLEDGATEVSPELVEKEIVAHIKQVSINGISEGKTQQEGMSKRLVRTEVENLLKKELGVDGQIDEMVATLKTKLSNVTGPKDGDSEIIQKNKALKLKISGLESDLQAERSIISSMKTNGKVKAKMADTLAKFDFSTPTVKKVAIETYLESRKFTFSDEDIFVDIDGTLSAKFNEDVEKHMLTYAKQLEEKKVEKKPGNLKLDEATYSNDLTELNKQYALAKTADEKKTILAKIKEVMASNK